MKTLAGKLSNIIGQLAADQSAEPYHKAANTYVVGPVISISAIIFFSLTYFDSWKWYLAVFLGSSVAMLNQLVVFNYSQKRLFGRIPVRHDVLDTVRSLLSLAIADIPVMFLVDPSPILMFGMFLVLTLGFFFESYGFWNRLIVVVSSSLAMSVCLVIVGGVPIPAAGFCSVAVLSIVIWFWGVQYFWIDSIGKRIKAETVAIQARQESEQLFRNAILGESARVITHEIGNVMMIIDLATANPTDPDLPAVRKSLRQISRLSSLVLTDLEKGPAERVISVNEIVSDIKMLLQKSSMKQSVEWVNDFAYEEDVKVRERSGSIFFIIQNIVRNSIRAFERNSITGRRIVFKVKASDHKIVFSIEDNAGGIPRPVLDSILDPDVKKIEYSEGGHGLGTQFVLRECSKNGFEVDIDTDGETFTRVDIAADILDPKSGHLVRLTS